MADGAGGYLVVVASVFGGVIAVGSAIGALVDRKHRIRGAVIGAPLALGAFITMNTIRNNQQAAKVAAEDKIALAFHKAYPQLTGPF